MCRKFLCASSTAILLLACDSAELPVESGSPLNELGAMAAAGSGSAPAASCSAGAAGPAAPNAGSLALDGTTSRGSVAGSGAAAAGPVGPSGIFVDSATGEVVFRTDPVELEPSQESYVCFAATLEQDVVVDGFAKSAQPFVHHMQFVETFLPEPEGISECKEQFKLTWLPIFLAGAGASELQLDEGVGHVLPSGTQLVLQMHLLNTQEHAIKQAVEIRMSQSSSPDPTPVVPWAIGSADIRIPAGQAGTAQKVCTQTGPVEVLAVFPHMHTHGRRMTIEVGKTLDAMKPLYTRDPFDFDDQRMEKVKFSLDTDDLLRVTCDYMNTSDAEVGFGESTLDEMCFFVGFALADGAPADCPDLWEQLFTL